MHAHIEHESMTKVPKENLPKLKMELTAERADGAGRVETLRGTAFLGFMRQADGRVATAAQGDLAELIRLYFDMPEMLETISDILHDKVKEAEKMEGEHKCRCPHGHH